MGEWPFHIRVAIGLQRGLLGEITSQIRAITCDIQGNHVDIYCYHDGEAAEGLFDDMSSAEAELIADFPEKEISTRLELVRVDSPQPIEKYFKLTVYARKEQFIATKRLQ